MKRFIAMILLASVTLVQAQTMGRLPGVLFPSDRGGRTSANLNTQITAVSTTPYRFILDRGTWAITENVSFPATITVELLPGAVFSIANGVNLEILGGFDAPDAEVFTGTGTASGPATFPHRHIDWGSTNLYNIGAGYMASAARVDGVDAALAVVTNQFAVLEGDVAGWGAVITNLDVYITAVDGSYNNLSNLFYTLNADVGTINTNFATVSNDFTIVAGVVNDNADLLVTNAVAHNYNFTNVLYNLFDDVFAGIPGWDGADYLASLSMASTNASYIPPGVLGNYASLTNWYSNEMVTYTTNVVTPYVEPVGSIATCLTVGDGPTALSVNASTYVYLPIGNYAIASKTHGIFSTSDISTYAITIPEDGTYLVNASFGSSDAETLITYVHITDAADNVIDDATAVYYSNVKEGSTSSPYRLSAGQKVKMGVKAGSSTTVNIPWVGLNIVRLNASE